MTPPLPADAYTTLEDMTVCRLLNGLWQVSGAHGPINANAAVAEMRAYHEAGLTTWDLADHYGPAEDFIGRFRARLSADELAAHLAFTKWVPRPGPMTRAVVAAALDRSRARMNVETLDMLQFHWWDYADRRYLDALDALAALREAGVVRHLALTNFDTPTLQTITEHGVRVVSNQVQYSIVDRRPEVALAPYCVGQHIGLLAYGTLAGGLLTDRYLNQPEPPPSTLNTASLRKYKQMIDLWGGWALFQDLLQTLRRIADRYDVSIANVAVRYVLERPAVAGVIVGARLSVREHIADNLRVFGFKLAPADLDAIHAVTARANDLFARIGDTGDEYRRR